MGAISGKRSSTTSGGSVGIGFAIPAEIADKVTKQLMSGGKVQRGYIGATIQNFTAEMAEAQGLGAQKGAIISDLVPGGPSSRAGLTPGDVVVSINGVNVRTSSELTREVAKARPGDILRLDVIREGKHRNVEIHSGIRPSEKELASNDNGAAKRGEGGAAPGTPEASSVLGLSLSPLDDAARRRLNAPAELRGVLVEGVDQGSDAGQKGLRRGDVIVQASGRPVTSAADVVAAVDAAKKAGRANVLLGVFRAGRTTFLPVKVAG